MKNKYVTFSDIMGGHHTFNRSTIVGFSAGISAVATTLYLDSGAAISINFLLVNNVIEKLKEFDERESQGAET